MFLVIWWINIENRDVAVHTLPVSLRGGVSKTEKVVLKWIIPFLSIEERETLAFTCDWPFHTSQLTMNQTEPSGKM